MKTAVLIPCYNEASTIADVVVSFKKCLPNAVVYVCDNCSDDGTAEIARKAGAVIMTAKIRGKGNAVRKMFADIDADVYIMADGDSTYKADDAPRMISALIDEKADMVVAVRREKSKTAYKSGHKFGNRLFNFVLEILFNSTFQDIFSGYRVFSKRFIKTFPVMSDGFDIEAELSIHALTLAVPWIEIDSDYFERPPDSFSKLNTIKDGLKILFSIIKLFQATRPLFFFGIFFIGLFMLSAGISYPLIKTFSETGTVPKLSTAVLSTGIMMLSFFSLVCGVITDGISRTRTEIKKLQYLQFNLPFY
jgi:glycosyltransferase involved in cell wall biosynthesis